MSEIAKYIQTLVQILKNASGPLSVDEIADRAGVSIRTVRRWIAEAEKLNILIVKKIGNKFYYQLKFKTLDNFIDSTTNQVYLTKLQQIVDSLEMLKERQENLYRKLIAIKEHIQNTKPKELVKEVLEYLDAKKRRLEVKAEKNEDAKKELEKLERKYKFVKHLLNENCILDKIRSVEECERDFLRFNNVDKIGIIGSDASRDKLSLVWHLGEIPLSLELMIVSCVAYRGFYNFKEEIFQFEEPLRFPQMPLAAGESYIEDISGKFGSEDEYEKDRIILNYMNYAHFRSDEEVIEQIVGPCIFFHDGRIIPPDISYLDFTKSYRRELLKKIFTKVISVRNTAKHNNIIYVGCVKDVKEEYSILKLITEALLSKIGVSNSELNFISRIKELQLASLLLEDGQRSFLVKTNLILSYLPDAKTEKRALKFAFENDENMFRWYKDTLKAFDCYMFYIKPKRDASFGRVIPARYEIDANSLDPTTIITNSNIVAYVVDKIAVPHSSSSTIPERLSIYVPNVICYADNEAKSWNTSIKTYLYEYLRSRLLGR